MALVHLPLLKSNHLHFYSHADLARNNGTEQTSTREQQAQAQGDDDVVELVEDDESECDLSDYLTMTSQWSDIDEQVEWWHLPPSWMVSNSPASSSITTVTPLPASQLSSIRGATEVDSGKEREGEGEEGVNVMKRMQGANTRPRVAQTISVSDSAICAIARRT